MPTGRIITYIEKRGFGFIQAQPDNMFFHFTALPDGCIPQRDDWVRYEIQTGLDRRPRAINVVPVDAAAIEEVDRVFG
ncbi:cold-shock protein [Mesorhizobium sp. A623]